MTLSRSKMVRDTIDLVLFFLPISHRGTFYPISRQDSPRNDTESIPSQVNQRGFCVPDSGPPLLAGNGFLYMCSQERGGEDVGRWTSTSRFGATKVEEVGHDGYTHSDEKGARRAQELVGGCARVERVIFGFRLCRRHACTAMATATRTFVFKVAIADMSPVRTCPKWSASTSAYDMGYPWEEKTFLPL